VRWQKDKVRSLIWFSALTLLQCFDVIVGWQKGYISVPFICDPFSALKLSGRVLEWLSVWSEVQTCIWPSWCHCHSLSVASVKSTLVLPFWYRLTWVVPDKGLLNVCMCACCLCQITSAAPYGIMVKFQKVVILKQFHYNVTHDAAICRSLFTRILKLANDRKCDDWLLFNKCWQLRNRKKRLKTRKERNRSKGLSVSKEVKEAKRSAQVHFLSYYFSQ